MAPVTTSVIGLASQIIDDPKLRDLLEKLRSFDVHDETGVPVDVDAFVATIETCLTWQFEEQADLNEWIQPLDAVDAILTKYLKEYPSLLLVAPLPRKSQPRKDAGTLDSSTRLYAESLEDVASVPESVIATLCALLMFLSSLLRNSTSKSVFNSVDELVDLLAAADDAVADHALDALHNLALPASVHKQQAPDLQQNPTSLHSSKNGCHRRLLALAKGWGTRGSGLGLLACVTADDSEYGQGSLPKEPGVLNFEFFSKPAEGAEAKLVKLSLGASDMTIDEDLDSMDVESSKQKRRRTASLTDRLRGKGTQSTATLFFYGVEQAGGRNVFPDDRLFLLLADVRLARAFHSRSARVSAVERRLSALITTLYCHPSQEVMSGYFQAQPELCSELIDLLRPTVSSAAVSASSAVPVEETSSGDLPAIAALANSPQVPYAVRTLSVETLTALVSRRDGGSGGLTGVAKQANVLNELGVGKGQYLGLLPTLIRYSLASLSSFVSIRHEVSVAEKETGRMETDHDESVGINLGLMFVKAVRPPSMPVREQLKRALEFVDSVLTLTSSVISAPSGTAALTECGLIPALLNTISSNAKISPNFFQSEDSGSDEEDQRCVHALLRFITSQVIQIVEGAIATHNNALSAFHDLDGVDILVSRLVSELSEIRQQGCADQSRDGVGGGTINADSLSTQDAMQIDQNIDSRRLSWSRRVLLFSAVNCLAIVFHQEASSSAAAATPGGAQLRKPELTGALKEIIEHVHSYGGVLAALTSTLLSDVINSDPRVVHHVHQSGLARSFLDMLTGKHQEAGEQGFAIPAVSELLMAIPNVVSALALTEDGANVILKANPFPAILSVFYSPFYAMPQSRCLLNEMTAIVGTSLDEIMRHVPRLRPLVLSAIVEALAKVEELGVSLMRKEEEHTNPEMSDNVLGSALENERSALIQYVLNFGQMLEQVLHNEDHCEPFVAAGGLDGILRLFPLMMPASYAFLAHLSSLSCPSLCTLAHSTTEDSLMLVFKCIALHCDSGKLIRKLSGIVDEQLRSTGDVQTSVRSSFPLMDGSTCSVENHSAFGVLEGLPRKPLHALIGDRRFMSEASTLSKYFRSVVTLQWHTNLLACAIRSASTRSQEAGADWNRYEREWKKEIISGSFWELISRLSLFHQTAILEACRIRTEDGFEDRERKRLMKLEGGQVHYRLRIVCQEGAVVRDGIEIDSCASIGSAEFGEIVEATDRCMNSSGILRYRTRRGWVSELTRGHGREPIAEVLRTWTVPYDDDDGGGGVIWIKEPKKRLDFGVCDICATGASVLARLQNSYSELVTCLGRVIAQDVRKFPSRNVTFEEGSVGYHVATLTSNLSSTIQKSLEMTPLLSVVSPSTGKSDISYPVSLSSTGAAMYLGAILGCISGFLFEEKRERKSVNALLLLSLIHSDPILNFLFVKKPFQALLPGLPFGLFGAVQFVFKQCLADLADEQPMSAENMVAKNTYKLPNLSMSRAVAASFPPAYTLLRRLMSSSFTGSASSAAVLGRMKSTAFVILVKRSCGNREHEFYPFQLDDFARSVHCAVSELALELWTDSRLRCAPAHLVHPIATLALDVVKSLENLSESPSPEANGGARGRWRLFSRGAQGSENDSGNRDTSPNNAVFEPTESSISQLMEMGFSRERSLHALRSIQSNNVASAMEYALSHDPSNALEEMQQMRSQQDGSPASEAASGHGEALSRQPQTNEESEESMDIDAATTESEGPEDRSNGTKRELDELLSDRIKCCLSAWIEKSATSAVDLISSNGQCSSCPEISEDGDGDREALTVVLTLFLLEVCQRFPKEQSRIIEALLIQLKNQIDCETMEYDSAVVSGQEPCFASLCHAVVLTVRALPRTRLLLLQQDLVHHLVCCVENFVSQRNKLREEVMESRPWPKWLAPTLLLLDVMAQPVALFTDASKDESAPAEAELALVRKEHREQAAALSETARLFFAESAIRADGELGNGSSTASRANGVEQTTTSSHSKDEKNAATLSFRSIPPLFPLIPSESVEKCLHFCLDLLEGNPEEEKSYPPPGTIHAVLLLLTRLLRSPQIASKCLRMGATELILALPRTCRFSGSACLVTVTLRRLLEDSWTLQSAMETEIRGVVTKLYGKERVGSSSDEPPSAKLKSFVAAVTPLLCRDPVTFLRATASITRVMSKKETPPVVVLLSPEEVRKNRVLQSIDPTRRTSKVETGTSDSGVVHLGKEEDDQSGKRSGRTSSGKARVMKRKHQVRSSPSRRNVSSRKFKSDGTDQFKKKCSMTAPPANHVTCLLMSKTFSLCSEAGGFLGEKDSFLWVSDLLEILTDLVLSVPACAAAIQRYRPPSSVAESISAQHALRGCPDPPRTFVSFLLHNLLPQDRWSLKKDQVWDREAEEDEKAKLKRTDYLKRVKVAQNAARLLVSLVARAGEGRRRVVADLTYALSGGLLGSVQTTPSSSPISKGSGEYELHALQAWGDLCIGLAAPRSNGSNHDTNSSLSFEVVKLMLDLGMAHALMYSIHRVKLHHPMAAAACTSLLVPFEVFTRSSVSDAVQLIADKEAEEKAKSLGVSDAALSKATKSKNTHDALEALHRVEGSFVEDSMFADGFGAETREGNVRSESDIVDMAYEGVSDEQAETNESSASDPTDVEMDEVADDRDRDSADEDTSSDEDTGESSENSDDVEIEDEIESLMSDENEDLIEDDDDEEEEDRWNTDDFFEGGPADNAEGAAQRQSESEVDEGWTRIDAFRGAGGVLLGERRNAPQVSARARGFIDVAEAMIGSLLRSGELQGDTLAEIEGTLGIQILTHGRSDERGRPHAERVEPPSEWGSSATFASRLDRSSSSRGTGEMVGTVPHIQQRSPPEMSFLIGGGGSRWNEISYMELVYGGVTVASRNFDLITPVRHEENGEDVPNQSQGDFELFPGGPAASTHSRTQQSIHPLLRGVDLPPMNSLITDLPPNSVRSLQRGHAASRRPGDLYSSSLTDGYLVATSNGNLLRLSRGQSGSPWLDSTTATWNGWTDGGLPLDATMTEYAQAFERALEEAVVSARSTGLTGSSPDVQESASDSATGVAEATPVAEGTETSLVREAQEVGHDRAEEAVPGGHNSTSRSNCSGIDSPGREAAQNDSSLNGRDISGDSAAAGSGSASDGDGVASSLATALRLSPQSESISMQSDPVAARNAGETELVQEGGRQAEEQSTAALPSEDAQQPNPSPTESITGISSPNEDIGRNDVGGPNEEPENSSNDRLVCPPGMDSEVFNSLPIEMQREVVAQHQTATDVAAQLDASSGLDPEALAALPEDMRREVIEQEQRERRLREQAPADPSQAEEMDNASFLASLAPELRREILLTADEEFLNSLPPNIMAEAQLLRERASAGSRRFNDDGLVAGTRSHEGDVVTQPSDIRARSSTSDAAMVARRRNRSGKIKVESDRSEILYLPKSGQAALSPVIGCSDLEAFVRLMYLLSPIRPQRILQKVFLNLSMQPTLRSILWTTFVRLLNSDGAAAVSALRSIERQHHFSDHWRRQIDEDFGSKSDFPPTSLIGTTPDVLDLENFNTNFSFRRRAGGSCAASIAANLPTSARGSSGHYMPPVVATRIVDLLSFLTKNSPRACLDALNTPMVAISSQTQEEATPPLSALLDLLQMPRYMKSSTNLEQLLGLLEHIVSPLSLIPKDGGTTQEISDKEIDAALSSGKEWVDVPKVAVSQPRLQLLCSILRMESCKETCFTKVNGIARRLCRVEANRGFVLAELASVAQALGADAVRDLRALHIRMNDAILLHKDRLEGQSATESARSAGQQEILTGGIPSSSVTLSTSTSELKLLRVLQTLHSLCCDHPHDENGARKNEGVTTISQELVVILHSMDISDLWEQLSSCLKMVKVLEGVSTLQEIDEEAEDANGTDDASGDDVVSGAKKLQNSVAGLLTRFLPVIEAFFIVNASFTRAPASDGASGEGKESTAGQELANSLSLSTVDSQTTGENLPASKEDEELGALVDGKSVVDFVATNRVLLNAMVRNNPSLLEKGLRSLVQVSRCRVLLDFDVKRQWFKTQVRRLRQQASRRYGSLRLAIRRDFVFEDAYHQLRLRNADEMRGRLHVTFRNEEGVDAGGLSREFFAILAKEIFNPNYALFTSTEDGCTFQPNPNSKINSDHLSYFRFVGRIVGKAVADGFLLDAHFTRSLYKHMLGVKPTHDDMEAIDPDYYRNLKTILEYDLSDIGLDLTFSTEDHSFGRSQVINLIPNGRNIRVTEETKKKYVSLVCQHRMTTAIESQINAYLDGFYELVSKDLIEIFTPKELELLISGLPDIDVQDLKQNTDYQGYRPSDKEIQWFWNVLFSLSRSEKAAFLQFVTGSSKVPLAGFSELQGMRGVQKFSIHKVGGSSGQLMSAHTCFNSLDLPVYKSEEEMREKLLYAISEGGGAFMFA